MLVQHWIVLVGCWHLPERRRIKAAQALQGHARHLAATFAGYDRLCQALEIVARCLTTGRLNTRKTAPTTAQLLLALEPEGLA